MSEKGIASRENQNNPVYGFYGRLRPEFPSQIIMDITEVCNLACIHCQHPTFKKSEHYDGRSLDPELNTKVVDEVRTQDHEITRYIRYTGAGEPLIHPNAYEMMKHAVTDSGVTVTLTTNGTLLTHKNIERLLDTGIHIVDISIDALQNETYARIRAKGNLDVTRANVINLLTLSKQSRRTKVVVSYIEQPMNASETGDFESFWKDQGADYVVVRRLHSNAGASADIAKQMRVQNAREKRRPCVYPWERIILNSRGYLSFCPADWTSGSAVADYRMTTIHETWQRSFYQQLRRAHLTSEFADHRFCGQCPDWIMTRWPGRGRSYADMIEDFKTTE